MKGANSLEGTLQLFLVWGHITIEVIVGRINVVSPFRKRSNLNYKTSVEDRLNKWYD